MYKKILLFLTFIGSFLLFFTNAKAQSNNQKQSYYQALGSKRLNIIDEQLKLIDHSFGDEKEAFEGALLMRKAGLITIPAKKLVVFKRGNQKLEASISKHPNNTEYRFLRLIIQENAPKVLGYSKNIIQDAKFIKENHKSMPVIAQKSLATYCKTSMAIPSGSF